MGFTLPLPPTLFLLFLAAMTLVRIVFAETILLFYPWNLAGIPLFVGGLLLSWLGARKFKRVGTNIHTFKEPDLFVTDHLYGFSRNPMYLGFALAIFGMAIVLGNPCSFAFALLFFVLLERCYIRYEERILEERFGEAYRAYRAKTRRWL